MLCLPGKLVMIRWWLDIRFAHTLILIVISNHAQCHVYNDDQFWLLRKKMPFHITISTCYKEVVYDIKYKSSLITHNIIKPTSFGKCVANNMILVLKRKVCQLIVQGSLLWPLYVSENHMFETFRWDIRFTTPGMSYL